MNLAQLLMTNVCLMALKILNSIYILRGLPQCLGSNSLEGCFVLYWILLRKQNFIIEKSLCCKTCTLENMNGSDY